VFALLLLSSCRPGHHLELPVPHESTELDGAARESILNQLRTNITPRSFRALLETLIEGQDQREQFRQAVTFEQPEQLRVEAFGSGLNQMIFLAVVSDGRLRAIIPQDKQLLYGRANRKAVQYLLSIPLSADELMAWLTGGILPAFASLSNAKVYSVGLDSYLVSVKDREGRMLRISGKVAALPRFEKFSLTIGGDGVLLGAYSYGAFPTSSVPEGITFTLPEASGRIVVTRPQINPDLSATRGQLFRIPEPNGYSRLEIGE